ncbi:serine/threonine-protein kinase [Actinophytocola sp. KF-1]
MHSIWRAERVVAGRYRLAAPVGEGAMGTVWRAFDLRLGRVVAIKQLRVPAGDDAAPARRRVIREARAAARLQHPNAVAVHDVATDDLGNPVLVMEYVPSRSLAAVLDDGGVLPVAQVASIGAQLAAALAAGHAAGIVHRDVKPANVLLGVDGSAKITDFGLARSVDDGAVTDTGLLAGTPAFLAPEAAYGEAPTPATDVFSLGATLYAALEGTPPFGTAANPVAQLQRVAEGGAPPPRNAGALTAPIMAMLRDDPAARPTIGEVADTLAAAGAPTRLDLRPLPAAAPPPRRRHLAFVAMAALVVGLLTLLLLTTWPVGRADRGAAAALTTTSTPPPAPDAEVLRQTVTRFYALVADDPGQAWSLLGPALRDQGRDRFEERWRDVTGLLVTGAPTVSGDTVVVEIEYTAGAHVRETHRHTLLAQDGAVLINSDEVVDSATATATTATTTTTAVTGEDKGRGRGPKKDVGRGGT